MLSFSSVLNVHCKHSFGFRMVSPSGKTFVFSGDTEKCDNVINAAKEADILIHEATFESDMIADAKFKKHSTIEDALAVRTPDLSSPEISCSIEVTHVTPEQTDVPQPCRLSKPSGASQCKHKTPSPLYLQSFLPSPTIAVAKLVHVHTVLLLRCRWLRRRSARRWC